MVNGHALKHLDIFTVKSSIKKYKLEILTVWSSKSGMATDWKKLSLCWALFSRTELQFGPYEESEELKPLKSYQQDDLLVHTYILPVNLMCFV